MQKPLLGPETAKMKKRTTSKDIAVRSLKRSPRKLLDDIRTLIESTRTSVARAVNTGLVMLYWGIGRKIREEILKNTRAEYGEQIVQTLSAQLTQDYGSGFGR